MRKYKIAALPLNVVRFKTLYRHYPDIADLVDSFCECNENEVCERKKVPIRSEWKKLREFMNDNNIDLIID